MYSSNPLEKQQMFWDEHERLANFGGEQLIGRRPHPPVQTEQNELTNADCVLHIEEETAWWDLTQVQQWNRRCSKSIICFNAGNSDKLLGQTLKLLETLKALLHPGSVHLQVSEHLKKNPTAAL